MTGQGAGPNIADSAEIGDYSNVPLCPNQWASKDIYDQPFELELLAAQGFTVAALGERPLRVEVAVPALLAALGPFPT